MPRGRKPGSKNKPKTVTNVEPIQVTKDTLEDSFTSNLEQEDTYKDSKAEVRETVISCVSDSDVCQIYTNERYWRNFCYRMLEEHPEDCKLVREYPEDGTVEITMPVAAVRYIRYPTKRQLTDEQKLAAIERGKRLGELRRKNNAKT